jgi:SAM-dependent methyltransferase
MLGRVAPDSWSSADQYDPFIGRWSRLVARELVAWLDPPAGQRWLDVGCGTGALSEAMLAGAAPASLVGIDPSSAYVARAAQRIDDGRASFRVGDAAALALPDASVDRVGCGLVLNFVPDAPAAVGEMRRVLVHGGIAAAYVWDYSGGMQMLHHFWDAAVAEDPAAAALDEGVRFPICWQGALAECFVSAGLDRVRERAIEVPTAFRDFDDYWTPFLGGQGPAPGYCAGLTDDQLERLRTRLRAGLPTGADGSIRLTARAWAVQGTAP